LELNKFSLVVRKKMLQEEKTPYRFSELADLMQQTHAQYHKIVQSCKGKDDIQSQWDEVEETFAQMFNMLVTQVPLIQVKFQGKLTACQNINVALTSENNKLTKDLQVSKAKLLQYIKSTTQVENKDLQDENEKLRGQLATLQRGLNTTQSALREAEKKLVNFSNLDADCQAEISDLESRNLELKQQVERLNDELAEHMQRGSDVSAEGGSRY
jgi:chromosome segregation ATPase